MRYIFLTLLTILFAFTLSAQTARPAELISGLAMPDPIRGSRVTVEQTGNLGNILNRSRSLEGKTIEGYRVYIFLDNTQDARAKGEQAKAQFQNAFPDIPAEISYENPYWKVAVGNCLTKDEAMIVFGRVKGRFTSAYVRKENLPLKNFLRGSAIAEEPEAE